MNEALGKSCAHTGNKLNKYNNRGGEIIDYQWSMGEMNQIPDAEFGGLMEAIHQTCDLLHAIYYYYQNFEILPLLLLLLLQPLNYITITITLPSITITISNTITFVTISKLECYPIFSIYIL